MDSFQTTGVGLVVSDDEQVAAGEGEFTLQFDYSMIPTMI